MTDQTPNLDLPYILAAQAQKHVTHNEALRLLDAVVQLTVLDRLLNDPPATPANGDRYIVAASPSGGWAAAAADDIAAFQDGAWIFITPKPGWLAWVVSEQALLVWNGSAWVPAAAGGGGGGGVTLNPVTGGLIGINATADTTNRLSLSAAAALFSHAGAGHQLKINKAAGTDTASLLFQTGFSGRAEFGTAGDDDFRIKVSADGTVWSEAMVVDRTSGSVSFPNTSFASGGGINPNIVINGDFQINQRVFAGGALSAGVYGFDRWKAATGGANVSVSGMVVTLASGAIEQVIEPALWGYVSFASQAVTVSADTPSADITVTLGSQSGTITAGSGRRSVTLNLGAGDTGNLTLKLAVAASTTFGRVKAEVSAAATGWQARDQAAEMLLCRRYYRKSYNLETAPGTATAIGMAASPTDGASTTGDKLVYVPMIYPMRAAPSISYWDHLGNATKFSNHVAIAGNIAPGANGGPSQIGSEGWWMRIDPSSAIFGFSFHYAVDAEL